MKEYNSVDVVRMTQDQKTIQFTMMAQTTIDIEMYFRCDPGMGQPSMGWPPFYHVSEKLVNALHIIYFNSNLTDDVWFESR